MCGLEMMTGGFKKTEIEANQMKIRVLLLIGSLSFVKEVKAFLIHL